MRGHEHGVSVAKHFEVIGAIQEAHPSSHSFVVAPLNPNQPVIS